MRADCLATKLVGVALVGSLFGCLAESFPVDQPPLPETSVSDSPLRRLTADQYARALSDALGEGLVMPTSLEPDLPSGGLLALGAARNSISGWGVERYESAAYDLAQQALESPERRAQLVPCTASGNVDPTCTRAFVDKVGRRLWRRPLTDVEATALVQVGTTAAETLGDFDVGLEFVLAGLLQSPNFLYRYERAGPAVDDWALASRLSFFLWNAPPDEVLLDAAATGDLRTDAGYDAQLTRMLDSPRAREGVRAFFTDMLELHRLDDLTKDPVVFVHFDSGLGPAAREQTLRDIERWVFELDGDYRDLFIARQTFVDRRLAAIYNVPAPTREGFGLVTLPAEGGRRGLLGQVSTLALHSHAVGTSAVLRGRFVRTVLLCGQIPPPPVDVNTALPEPTEVAPTLRDRNRVHLENPACAGCHTLMDPIGLGLENFDGIGRWRTFDNGAEIDATGLLDGEPFQDAWSLAQRVRSHPRLPQCLVQQLYRYAIGTELTTEQDALVGALADRFAANGYRVRALLADIALSSGFRGIEGAAK